MALHAALRRMSLLALALLTGNALAEGSRTLHPAGETDATTGRAVMGLNAATLYFPGNVVSGLQFLYVYAQAGEHILLGSRNRTSTNVGKIFVYAPRDFGPKGAETSLSQSDAAFVCGTSPQLGGLIADRAAELAGPRSADNTQDGGNAKRYQACAYKVPTSGIYGVVFSGSSSGSNTDKIDPPPLITNAVSAWDVTVRGSDPQSLNDLNGRVFTYAWAVNTGNNNVNSGGMTNRAYRLSTSLYYVSVDGYRYRQDLKGLDPNAATFFANSAGFLDTNGAPLYRDYRGGNSNVIGGASSAAGIQAPPPQYPIFFSDISPTGPNAAEVNRVLTALSFPQEPKAPELRQPAFVGNVANHITTVSSGGTFTFDVLHTQTYEIVLSRDGVNFDPAHPLNRVLTGVAYTGSYSVLWDGKDNDGTAFPQGVYKYRIVGRNGEIHFPMADVEGNVNGGPILTKLNGPNTGDTTVYYDDRGYTAANGVTIGVHNGALCGGAAGASQPQPVPAYSLMGIDSAQVLSTSSGYPVYYRSWTGTKNPNADCTDRAQFFGDSKGLDLWALEKSQVYEPELEVVEPKNAVDVGTQVAVTPSVLAGESAYGTFSFGNAGSSVATGVTYRLVLGQSGTCPSAVQFPLTPPGVNAIYNPSTCEVNFSGMPASLAVGQSLLFNFNYVVEVGNPGPIPATSFVTAANETPDATVANTATAHTVVAQPVVSVSKSAMPSAGANVRPGEIIYYTVSASVGAAPLTQPLVLTDVIGGGLQFDGIESQSPALSCSASLTCTLAAKTTPGVYSVTYRAKVTSTAGPSVKNQVTALGGGGNTPPTCDPCTVVHPVANPTLTVAKTIAGRARDTDQFQIGISDGGPTRISAGAESHISTPTFDATPGVTYTLSESGAGHPAADLSRYTSTWSCVNFGNGGNGASVGTGTSVNVTPRLGDHIVCTFTNTPIFPKVRARKSVSANPLLVDAVGQSYRIEVEIQDGPTTAPIRVADALPAGIVLADSPSVGAGATLSGCAGAGSSSLGAACQLDSGLPDGRYEIVIPVTVSSAAMASGAINRAHLSGGGDPACTVGNADVDCDPQTPPIAVERVVDLGIVKTASPADTYLPGEDVNYTIVVTNTGPSMAVDAVVTDRVPSKVRVSDWRCTAADPGASCGSVANGVGNDVQLQGVRLPAGTSLTIRISGKALSSATGSIVNTATVAPGPEHSCATLPCERSSTTTQRTLGVPGLSIQKIATPAVFAVGQSATYSLLVSNPGTGVTQGAIQVSDALPAGITLRSVLTDDAVWDCSASTSTQLACVSRAGVEWLPGMAAPVINLQVDVAPSLTAQVSNTAQVAGGGATCAAPVDACSSTVNTPINTPRLEVSKRLNGSFVVGRESQYLITVTNTGLVPTPAIGHVSDQIPALLGLVDMPAGCTHNLQIVSCAVPAGLAAGASVHFVIPVTPSPQAVGQSILNTAAVDRNAGDPDCPAAAHCSGTTDNPVLAPQLTLTKAVSVPTFTVQEEAAYLLVLTNTGTAATTQESTVTDTIVDGLTINEAALVDSGCQLDPPGSQTIVCKAPTGLAVNESKNFTIRVTPQPRLDGQSLNNTATATGGGDPLCAPNVPLGSLPARCVPAVTTPVQAPRLLLRKTAPEGSFSLGVLSHYVLQVSNEGTAPTKGLISISDRVPDGFQVGALPAGCTAAGQMVTCESQAVLQPAPSPDSELRFSIPVTPTMASVGSILNKAVVVGGGDPTCPLTENCVSTVTSTVNAPDLQLTKADNGPWQIGQVGQKYRLTVTNASPTVATVGDITVVDELPLHVSPDWSGSLVTGAFSCTASGQTVHCIRSTSMPGQAVDVIDLPVQLDSSVLGAAQSASLTNYAAVGGGGDPFLDGTTPTPGSTCAQLDANQPGHCASRVTTVHTPAALAVDKSDPVIEPGGAPGLYRARYTVSVRNTGGAAGIYTLRDTPEFPGAITLTAWQVTTQDGSLHASLPAVPVNGQSNVLSAESVALDALGEHAYTVAITFMASPLVSTNALVCNAGVSGMGALNTAHLVNNIGESIASDAGCASLPGVPLLSLAKSSNGPWTLDDTRAQYTLTVTNRGTASTSGALVVQDHMPEGVEPASTDFGAWTCTTEWDQLSCTSAAVLAPGDSQQLVIPVTLTEDAVGNVVNEASAGGGGDPTHGGTPPAPGSCLDGDTHCASVTTPVSKPMVGVPDLVVTKTNEVTRLLPGATTVYTVTLSNVGTASATGVTFTDMPESGLGDLRITGQSSSAGSSAGQCAGLTCTGVEVLPGGEVHYAIAATVVGAAGTEVVNHASVVGGNCTAQAPCLATDRDPIGSHIVVIPPPPATPVAVPVNARAMLGLLMVLMLVGLASSRKRRGVR
ncbi:hypothetical protein [Diaphorobacter sp.]|uniref:hypothetical protein n=1 Tax=Diaphorobacter sp. TaxID=1934310 RepID=UPI0028B19FF5|nr:hypothetical protein [Diaphorobacter sp.]